MKYYFNIQLGNIPFEDAVNMVTESLKEEGFGIITDIDMQATLKKKIDVDFKKYRILGACNPGLAFNAVQNEDKIGLMLPCNVVVEESEGGNVEASIIDPVASMMAIENESLKGVAEKVRSKLKGVAEKLSNATIEAR